MCVGMDFRNRFRDRVETHGYVQTTDLEELNAGWATFLVGALLRDVAAEQVGACPRCSEPIFDLSDTHCWECGLVLGNGV